MFEPLKPRYNEPKKSFVQRLSTDEHSMISTSLQYPIFGPDILCPHCRQQLPALTLTDAYLCHRHGAFEANAETKELVHLQSGRHWRRWEGEWYRQHTHPDGIRFEIHEALDRLYTEGYRATRVIIAQRYHDLINAYLERATSWIQVGESSDFPRLYGLPVEFSPDPQDDPRWYVINFAFEKEVGSPTHLPYSRFMD